MAARILIADDSPLVQTSLQRLLESYSSDWKVCGVAANGREAVQKALESQPDLIILDLRLPQMDGLRASFLIGKYLAKVPIVMYTLYKSMQLEASAKIAGVRDVISKSDPDALLKAAAKLLDRKQMAASGSST